MGFCPMNVAEKVPDANLFRLLRSERQLARDRIASGADLAKVSGTGLSLAEWSGEMGVLRLIVRDPLL